MTRTIPFVLVSILNMLMSQGKPVPPDPPLWEFHYEYELFQKVYEQTQALQRLLNQNLYKPKTCPEPWTTILDSCYFLPLHWTNNWLNSAETCERLGGHLAVLNSAEEDIQVSAYLTNVSLHELHQDPVYIWIGGFDFIKEGEWRWVNGERIDNYTNWRVPLEDSTVEIRKRENCLDWSNGWNDNSCSRKFHFLCERNKM